MHLTVKEEALEMARIIERGAEGVDFVQISGEPLQHLLRILRALGSSDGTESPTTHTSVST
jgi:hypothetical protein